jgi:hypothetical protein
MAARRIAMHDDPRIRDKAALQDEAVRIVATASAQGRSLTATEDSYVLALMGRVRALEEEIHRLKKHHAESQSDGRG